MLGVSLLCLCALLATGAAKAQAHQNSVAELRLRIASSLPGKHRAVPAIVWLEPLPGTPALPFNPDGPYTLLQKNRTFTPHLLVIPVGSVVQFPNADPFFHNVFSLSTAAGPNGFDLGRYPKGESRTVTFERPGTVQVFCHIHSDMSASVLVLQNPYFAQPADDHRYVIDDVPEGDYTIVGWHERAKLVIRRVHVTAGQTSTVDFNIPVPPAGNGR